MTWARNGGLTAVVFALPLLVIFGIFSWWPIVSAVIMSFQQTNLTDAPTWVGFDNFAAVLQDPLMPQVVRNTAWFALLAPGLRLSGAAHRRRFS
jgi:multiple sugar transport system permease protein